MASEEQYLDDLLKSMMEGEQKTRTMDDAMHDVEAAATPAKEDSREEWKDEIDELLRTEEPEEASGEKATEDLAKIPGEEVIEDSAEIPGNDVITDSVEIPDNEVIGNELNIPVEDIMGSTGNSTDDLSDITNMLNMSDHSGDSGVSDEDMLALLEGLQETPEEPGVEEEGVLEEAEEENAAPKEKKRNIFLRFLDFLTREEEEEQIQEQDIKENGEENATGENEQVIEELGEEDKAKGKNKKGRKGRKEKKGKKGKNTESENEEQAEEEETAEENNKKKKKPKKEKKEKKEKIKLPAQKVLTGKTMAALVALCASLIACIVFLSNILPEYADKVSARRSYYAGDYETVYMTLNHKRLNGSDAIIFDRAKSILTLQHKLDSYYNRMALGKELEAVDALFQGIEAYHSISDREVEIQTELSRIYQQLCDVLQKEYGITPEEADEINAYDDITYTRRLNSLVYGTEFYLPGQEPVEEEPPLPPQDVLPDEEEFIDMEKK